MPLDIRRFLLNGQGRPHRHLVYAGGGLVLLLLLTLQGALEQAVAPGTPVPTPGAGASADALPPDYSSFTAPSGVENVWWLAITGLVLKLFIVLVLIYATLWLLRRYLRRAPGATGEVQAVRLLETTPLGQHQRLHLVEVGDRVLVLGSTPQQITLLSEIADSSAIAELRLRSGQRAPADTSDFRELLTSSLGAVPTTPVKRSSTLHTANQRAATTGVDATPEAARLETRVLTPTPAGQDRPVARPSARESKPEVQQSLRRGQDAIQHQISRLRRSADRDS